MGESTGGCKLYLLHEVLVSVMAEEICQEASDRKLAPEPPVNCTAPASLCIRRSSPLLEGCTASGLMSGTAQLELHSGNL